MKKFFSLLLLLSLSGVSIAQQRGYPQSGASGVSYSGRMLSSSKGMNTPRSLVYNQYFEETLEVIASQRFEENRIQVARQMIARNYVCSDQVRQIINLFTFESSKLEFAKFAYSHVSDPANYFIVTQAFRFAFSTEELEQFIGYDLHNQHVCNTGCNHHEGLISQTGNQGTYNMAVMHHQDFAALVRTINASSFDSSKLAIARQAVRNNYVSSEQIRQLMFLLTFESSRLDLAKVAYRQVVDKENYFIVNDAFTFSSSIDELDRFLYR